ncbi:hypothetical protein [Kutzneria sp. CA-103260]|uniref:hypothetical protein n=1 Tax=Kutzneria sp. CA-103260 TaxID=2802641 RepID=UPI001BA5719D|nr:hypothetical protein [Kutzneria sp. CA-103260]QUQ62717.1 hypothetical protein JJ691_04290 [Kutzneria sp. CA-103260]
MIEPDPRFRADFDRLVADEGLDDVAGFRRPIESVDEVPLYSRLGQVLFLGRLANRERAAQLITAGAWQLGRLRTGLADLGPDFRCLLVLLDGERLDEDGLVTPAIWYTHRWRELSPRLRLGPARSDLARFAAEVLGPDALVEEAVTDGIGRVYIDV